MSAGSDVTLAAALREGAATLGLTLHESQIERLLAYLQLIQRWTRVYNLTAVRDAEGILSQHLLDSLAMLPPLHRHTAGVSLRLLDVGSGAGLPGLALAITAPELEVSCVDTVGKKVGFMRQVIAELGLSNASAIHSRVEDLPAARPWDLVTSRAFASLPDFVTLTQPLVAPGACWVAMKGRMPSEELIALPATIEVFHVEPIHVPKLDAERCLVWMRRRTVVP